MRINQAIAFTLCGCLFTVNIAQAVELYAYINFQEKTGSNNYQLFHIKNNNIKPIGATLKCDSTNFYITENTNKGIFYCKNKGESWLRGTFFPTKTTGFKWIGKKFVLYREGDNYKADVATISGFKLPVVYSNTSNINYSLGIPIINQDGSIKAIAYSPLGARWFGDRLFFIDKYNLILREGNYSHKKTRIKRKYQLFQLLPDMSLHKLASYDDLIESSGPVTDSGRAPTTKETDVNWLNGVKKIDVIRLHKRYFKASPSYYRTFKVIFSSTRGFWEIKSMSASTSEFDNAPPEKPGPPRGQMARWVSQSGKKYAFEQSNSNKSLSLFQFGKPIEIQPGLFTTPRKKIKTWSYLPDWERVNVLNAVRGINKLEPNN